MGSASTPKRYFGAARLGNSCTMINSSALFGPCRSLVARVNSSPCRSVRPAFPEYGYEYGRP
jgi:hypothetical protein